jgi:DNA-binding MarR family transcriptional regulator
VAPSRSTENDAVADEPEPSEQHPTLALDDLIHQRTRLGILTVLAEAGRCDFAYLRTTLALTDGNLSRHLQTLADAGLLMVDKVFEKRRPRTWVEITDAGRAALDLQLQAMRELLDRVERHHDDLG